MRDEVDEASGRKAFRESALDATSSFFTSTAGSAGVGCSSWAGGKGGDDLATWGGSAFRAVELRSSRDAPTVGGTGECGCNSDDS